MNVDQRTHFKMNNNFKDEPKNTLFGMNVDVGR